MPLPWLAAEKKRPFRSGPIDMAAPRAGQQDQLLPILQDIEFDNLAGCGGQFADDLSGLTGERGAAIIGKSQKPAAPSRKDKPLGTDLIDKSTLQQDVDNAIDRGARCPQCGSDCIPR